MLVGYLSSIFISSILLLISGFLLSKWKFTKKAGFALFNRVTNCHYNWINHPLRSWLELGSWLGVLWTIYWNSPEGNLLACVMYGNISGIVVVLTTEWLIPMNEHEERYSSKIPVGLKRNIAMNAYILFSMLYLALMFIFQYCKYIFLAVSMSIVASIVMILAGDFFARMETSKFAGNILQDRIQRCFYNWRFHFWRSAFEFTCWQSAIYISYYLSGNMITAVQTGACIGCIVVLFYDSCVRGRKSKEFGSVTPQIMSKLRYILEKQLISDVKFDYKQHQKINVYTMEEVAKHNTFEDCWIVYHENIIDVSGWKRHPGGRLLLERMAGRDATDEIKQYHFDLSIKKYLPMRCIGTVSDAPKPTPIQKDFRQLFQYFHKEGYFEPRLKDYVIKSFFCTIFFVTVWIMVIFSDSNAIHLCAAIILAIFFQQVAFIGHDLGHISVFCHRYQDAYMGLIAGNFLTGITLDWWKATHNVHHCVPNSLFDDPDIAHLPVFAVSPKFFKSIYHTFHRRVMEFNVFAQKICIPYQHYLYYPIMGFARYNLYLQSIIRLIKEPNIEKRFLEGLTLLGFYCWYFFLVSHLNSGVMIVAFTILSHACAGLLNVQITLSHFSMPVNEGRKCDYGGDFYRRNIESSMDISCSKWMDWFHGGLQFQTLHHVYPRMPRGNVRKSLPYIVALCKKHGITYKVMNFIDANIDVLQKLKETALKANVWSPQISDTFYAEG